MIASVFLGPSIALQEARAILPKAIFHPPASQGDLLSAIDQDGAEILGLIDGTFHQNLSVWHNEVCYLLSRGVAVYGASSMGALRAVETEKFGAIGVGCIYRWYRDGVITGDDEVALVHGDEDSDFRPLSLPLVNIRASMSLAIWNGLLDRLVAEQVINIAKSLYYPDRQVPAILQICREKGVGLDQVIATERALTINYVDLKRADAQEMLMVLARVLDGSVQTPKPPQFEFLRSSVFETLYNLDRKVRIEGNDISMQSIAEHVALHCTDFKEIKRSALDRALVVFLGSLLDIHVTRDEVIKERDVFCEERALNSPDSLSAWLRCNALCERDFWECVCGSTWEEGRRAVCGGVSVSRHLRVCGARSLPSFNRGKDSPQRPTKRQR